MLQLRSWLIALGSDYDYSGHFTPHNGKVADITHADVAKHTITLATMGLPTNATALILTVSRVAGAGVLRFYPNEGGFYIRPSGVVGETIVVVGIINQRLQYSQSVANDDFDLYCFGYLTR